MSNSDNNITNYLTIDVEDYSSSFSFENSIRFEDWGNYESRVVNNTRWILNIHYLSQGEIKATFLYTGMGCTETS